MTTYYARSYKELRVYQKAREKAGSFCGSPGRVLHEDSTEYFTTVDN